MSQPLLAVALNGSRDHPRIPRTPRELAREARRSVEAGARVIHLHPYKDGLETLGAEPCAAAITAVRIACPGIPISLSTSEQIEPDPGRRRRHVERWRVLPDLATANFGEAGIVELAEALIRRGVGIEAGLLSLRDAEVFIGSGLADRCVRILVEPLDEAPADAVEHAEAIEDVLSGLSTEQVHHGDGIASRAVNERALRRGHGIRTGLEDTPYLPDGTIAPDNAVLVRAARAMIRDTLG